MHYSLLHKGKKAIANLCENLDGLSFGNSVSRLVFEVFLEVPITQFLNYIVIIGGFQNINEANNILRPEGLHDFDFGNEGTFEVGVGVNVRFVDDLDRTGLMLFV